MQAKRPKQTWPRGQVPQWLSVVDEYTRHCITLNVGRKITSENVIDRLATLF